MPFCFFALPSYRITKTNMLVSITADSSCDFEVLKGGEHLALESLIVKIQRMDIFGRTAAFGATDAGQHWFNNFFPQDQQCG